MRVDLPPRSRSLAAIGLLAGIAAVALAAPWIWPDPARSDLDHVLEPPSLAHPFGTDSLGRDLLARVAHGGRVSLAVGLLAIGLALAVGVPLGALAGYRGGIVDLFVSRAVDAMLCFPALVLALSLLAAAPEWLRALPAPIRVALVVAATGWAVIARLLRGEVLRLRETGAITAARAAGAGAARILSRHLLPGALAPVLVTAAFGVGSAILVESALSFLGLGVSLPTPTWGGMLAEARNVIGQSWWSAFFPGAALFVSVLALNVLGEAVRDRLDPRGARSTS